MNAIQPKSIILSVSRIHPEGWWLGNTEENVAKGTALGADYTENIYTPSSDGMIGKYDVELDVWTEIKNKALDEFWTPNGQQCVIGLPDGDYPEWAVLEAPPEYDIQTQTVLYQDEKWLIYDIEIGKPYWDSEGNELIVSDYNFTLPDNHTYVEPPKLKEGHAVRLVETEWAYIADFRDSIIYDCTDATHSEVVQELGEIKEGFTLEQPKTQYDEWINQAWVTNKENQYIGDFNQVDDDRRQLYIRVCDPLIAEANIKRLQGFESEVSDIETQVLAARVEIQNSNPWPAPLTS
ncbi:hypothetical protein HC725_02115 [Vibrio sp. S17_S38]|uniref:hypothetical protein n=1 Tax=Vibrio sp. S17_S38 TaxID=2720229 RepID=UPI001680E50F|nr:hypothetical protein [Vibrio sp. S17_S38]MBD1572074.1 hypothetical protein [Vibrio sp. S17_S38]